MVAVLRAGSKRDWDGNVNASAAGKEDATLAGDHRLIPIGSGQLERRFRQRKSDGGRRPSRERYPVKLHQ